MRGDATCQGIASRKLIQTMSGGAGREGSRLHRMDRFEAECIGTRLLLANALLRDCWASNNLADRGRALAAARRAKDIFSAGGDPGGERTGTDRERPPFNRIMRYRQQAAIWTPFSAF